ncbi:MAG: sugar MFS transporter [Flexilinea sp.]
MKPYNRYELTAAISYCAMQFSLGLVYACIPPTISRLAANTNASLSMLAAAISIRGLVYVITTLFLGQLFDRFSGNKILAINTLMLIAFAFLFPRVRNYDLLVIVLVLFGVVSGIMDIGANTGMLWTLKERSGQAINIMYACYSLGLMTAPLLIGYSIRKYDSFSGMAFGLSLVSLPFGLILSRLRSPGKPSEIAIENSSESETTIKITTFSPLIISAAFFLLFEIGTETGFANWVPSIAFRTGIANEASAAALSTAFGAGSLLARLTNAFFIHKIRPEKILFSTVLLVFFSSSMIPFIPGLSVFFILAFLYGAGTGPVYATMLVYLGKKIHLTGKTTGFMLGMLGSGAAAITWIAGVAFDRAGIIAYAVLLSGTAFISLFLLFRLIRLK